MVIFKANYRNLFLIVSFFGQYIWRYSHRGILAPNFPVEVHQMFIHLPKHIDRIDAAYERPYDNALVFISGKLNDVIQNDQIQKDNPAKIIFKAL